MHLTLALQRSLLHFFELLIIRKKKCFRDNTSSLAKDDDPGCFSSENGRGLSPLACEYRNAVDRHLLLVDGETQWTASLC